MPSVGCPSARVTERRHHDACHVDTRLGAVLCRTAWGCADPLHQSQHPFWDVAHPHHRVVERDDALERPVHSIELGHRLGVSAGVCRAMEGMVMGAHRVGTLSS